ncbi:MAG: pyridoxal-phosphate dependent enzyme [Planctomycetaceae bacterium]|nr:pyridoxal-phosphate dependent enzyme [Planctomycetaceae bacterium]
MSEATPLFPKRDLHEFVIQAVSAALEQLEREVSAGASAPPPPRFASTLHGLLAALHDRFDVDPDAVLERFVTLAWPGILSASRQDFLRYPDQDPALSNAEEVLYSSNGFWATVAYRLANALRQLRVPILPRAISGFAHSRTGVDIHPGATIGPGLFIDHGTGIAIGCTAVLGQNVNLYNGVVLGTRSRPERTTNEQSGEVVKRHPTIGNGVSLYTNAFVGGDVSVGDNAVIGAYAFVCHDVAAGDVVTGREGTRPATANQSQGRLAVASPPAPPQATGVLGMIGNTPTVEITGFHDNPHVQIFAKLEGANPGGSVKDRIALSLIERGEASGELTREKIILESTSGNTGIGLAMVGAAKGYRVVLTMSAAMSEERKKVLRAFGATLVETDPKKGTGGAIEVARQMMADNPGVYWMSQQHSSFDNPLAHYERTAEEILQQVPDITHFVAGIGTFGTLRGAGGRLREANGTRVVGVEPVLGQPIQGLRNMNEPNAPSLYDESLLDLKLMAMAEEAHHYTRLLAARAGLLVGMSSGAAFQAALKVAGLIDVGKIVVLFPDRGEKYLSTPLFDAPLPTTADIQPDVLAPASVPPAAEPAAELSWQI